MSTHISLLPLHSLRPFVSWNFLFPVYLKRILSATLRSVKCENGIMQSIYRHASLSYGKQWRKKTAGDEGLVKFRKKRIMGWEG